MSISDEIDEFILDKISFEDDNDGKKSVFKLNRLDDNDSCSSRSSNTDIYHDDSDNENENDENEDEDEDENENQNEDEDDEDEDEDDDKEMNK